MTHYKNSLTTVCWPCSGSWTDQQVINALFTFNVLLNLRLILSHFSILFSIAEPLHGYRMCIQAIMMSKPKISTLHLSEVSAVQWLVGTWKTFWIILSWYDFWFIEFTEVLQSVNLGWSSKWSLCNISFYCLNPFCQLFYVMWPS